MKLKKHLKETIITLSVISLTAVGYAAVTTVADGDTLTATIWNNMKDIVNSNEAKLTNIYSLGGNVGIGTTTPTTKLDVNGEVKATSFDLGMEMVNSTCTILNVADECFATCPVGKYVVSGGCRTSVSTDYVRHTYPYSNTKWLCKMSNTGNLNAYVLCGNVKPW